FYDLASFFLRVDCSVALNIRESRTTVGHSSFDPTCFRAGTASVHVPLHPYCRLAAWRPLFPVWRDRPRSPRGATRNVDESTGAGAAAYSRRLPHRGRFV